MRPKQEEERGNKGGRNQRSGDYASHPGWQKNQVATLALALALSIMLTNSRPGRRSRKPIFPL